MEPNSNMRKPPFKYELILDFNDFNQQAAYHDMEALAKLFQNILFLQQGNLPNQHQLGVGIQNYQFEILDKELMRSLEAKIKEQCAKFAPNQYIYSVKLEKTMLSYGKTALTIFFYLSKWNKDKDEPNIAMLFNRHRSNNKLLSQIFV